MKLFEFQGKKLFRDAGIPTPEGRLVTPCDDYIPDQFPVVVKAQVLTGGRGKAGGVKVCKNREEYVSARDHIFEIEIKGYPVKALLVENVADIEKEFYLSILIDGSAGMPILIASSAGGMDIESVADETPEKIIKVPFHPVYGPADYQLREVAEKIGCSRARELGSVVKKLYRVMKDCETGLVEINPLVETPDGLVALDSKVDLDDQCYRRKQEFFGELYLKQVDLIGENEVERIGDEDTVTYVPLGGSVGLISDGAGTGMLTLDMISDTGGQAADFCEMGGITNSQVMFETLERVASNPAVKSLLVVLIGGFVRMDEMAEGIVRFYREKDSSIPLVVRLCGTMEKEGKEIMTGAGLKVYDDLSESVKDAVKLAEVS